MPKISNIGDIKCFSDINSEIKGLGTDIYFNPYKCIKYPDKEY